MTLILKANLARTRRAPLLSRTPFRAIIDARGSYGPEGPGPALRHQRVTPRRGLCRRDYRSGAMGLDPPRHPDTENPPPHMCAPASVRAYMYVVSWCRGVGVYLYPLEKKERKGGFHSDTAPDTAPTRASSAGAQWPNPLISQDKRGFCGW